MSIFACSPSSDTSSASTQETGVNPDQGSVGSDLNVVIHGRDFKPGSRVVMIPDFDRLPRILARIELQGGEQMAMAQFGDKVYLADGLNGFIIIDVSDPVAPRIIGQMDLSISGFVWDLAVGLDRAYIAVRGDGLLMVDTSDPEHPQLMGKIVAPYNYFQSVIRVRVAGNMAYVGVDGGNENPDEDNILYAVDISAGLEGDIVGLFEVPEPLGQMALQDDLIVLASGGSLMGVQITRTGALKPEDSVDIGTVAAISLTGQMAYGVNNAGTVFAVNISDPENMHIEGELALPFVSLPPKALVVSGTQALLFYYENLCEIDVKDPASMKAVGNIKAFGVGCCSMQMQLFGDIAFISNWEYTSNSHNSFYVVDVKNIDNPVADFQGFASALTTTAPVQLILDQNVMYMRQYGHGISIFDVSDPEHPQPLDTDSMREKATALAVSDQTVYVGLEDGLVRIYNADDPQRPELLSEFQVPDQNILKITRVDTILFIAANTCILEWDHWTCKTYLHTVDIGDLYNPTMTGTVEFKVANGGEPLFLGKPLGLKGGPPYFAAHSTFTSIRWFGIDLNDPFNPVAYEATFLDKEIRNVNIVGDHIFALDSDPVSPYHRTNSYLLTLDISNPASVEQVDRQSMPGAGIMSIDRNTAYIAFSRNNEYETEQQDGLYAIDLRNPENPRLIAEMLLPQFGANPWYFNDLVVYDGFAYLAVSDFGLCILPLPLEAKNAHVDSSTQISATLPGPKIPGSYTLRIFDENGASTSLGPVTFIR
jgi:hypothetical protein